jgi:hypothetical protein
MVDRLDKFLRGFRDSRSREYVLTTRLVHDLSVAAAASGYNLLVYLPTVDADGFDVILDDRDRLVAIQLKSVVRGGKAAGWRIRRSLVRPEPEQADLFGFECSPNGTGRGGGVILTTAAAVGENVEVGYSYTDIMVLSVLWSGIVSRPQPQQDRLRRLRKDLESEATGSVEIPRSAFLPAATPAKLLALMGLHSHVQSAWRSQMSHLLRHENLRADLPAPAATLRTGIADELQGLASRPGNNGLQSAAAGATMSRRGSPPAVSS